MCGTGSSLTELKIVPAKGLTISWLSLRNYNSSGAVTGMLKVVPNVGPAAPGLTIALEMLSFFVVPFNYMYRFAAIFDRVEILLSPFYCQSLLFGCLNWRSLSG